MQNLVQLQRRIDELEAENKYLRGIAVLPPFPSLPLTPQQARILHLIYRGYPASISTAQLIGILGITDGCLKVHLHLMRSRLARFGIRVHARYGYGYCLDEDSHTILQSYDSKRREVVPNAEATRSGGLVAPPAVHGQAAGVIHIGGQQVELRPV